ncbi:circularly permuted type 2 ATP-grasp protein [bacterium]|nr:circularly permuted type 2 ATP-grasp protein [bacterium]
MTTNIPEAIRFYNSSLETYAQSIPEIYQQFSKDCEKRKLTFGGRSMFNFLRPNFVSIEQYQYIRHVCKILRNAVTKFKQAALSDEKYLRQAGLIDKERSLVMIHPGYDRLSITARWDSFLSDEEFCFVELNAECPAGIAYSEIAADVYSRLPFVQDFKKRFRVHKFKIRQTLLDGLLKTYNEYRGNNKSKKPTIAIVDWREVPTYTEFELFKEFFESKGLNCVIADPRDLEYSNGRLKHNGTAIDLVYKRILTNDCVEKPDETKALVDAYRNHDVCMINPFRAKLVHKKSLFAVLTHEQNRNLFNSDELSVIAKHIPWTRLICNENTIFNGRKIDLVNYISINKNQFVIKPNDEYGGKGVYLGKETNETEWNQIINDAVNGEPYVVQEIVKIPRAAFPIVDNHSIKYVNMVVDLDPYVFGSKTEGLLTRLSSSSLANVTAGGGTTPTFVIERIATKKSRISAKVTLKTKSSNKIKNKVFKRSKNKKVSNRKKGKRNAR